MTITPAEILGLYIIFHLHCSVLTYGITFGYFQRKYHRTSGDRMFSVFFSLLGPASLITAYIRSERVKYGLKFK